MAHPVATILDKFHQHGCHPHVGAFLRGIDKVAPLPMSASKACVSDVVAAYAKAFERLYAEVHHEDMVKLIRNFERNSRKCYRGAVSMLRSVMSKHAKVLSLRLDLSYRYDRPHYLPAQVSHVQAKSHLAAFLLHLRRNTHLKVVGYCWAMEYAPTAGFHFHMWLLFNGHQHQNAAKIGHQLGSEWSTELTDGQGRYYLCNKGLERYAHLAVGMLHRGSVDWEGIHHIALYLTKPDFYLRYQPKEGGRTFGRSCIKRQGARA